jgi:hypothetical protein
MLEITYTEIFLFAWGSIMTALYFSAKHEARMARVVFMHFVENPEAREQMVAQYEKTRSEA